MPFGTDKYSVITEGDANIKAHAIYGEVAIGGRLIDGTVDEYATVCNNPFDVVKSRLQAKVTSGSSCARAESILANLLDIWRTEGWRGLYVGFVPKALRMGIGGAVGMTAFEAASAAMALA